MTTDKLFEKLPEAPHSNHRILLLTHNDLDGSGSSVVLNTVYRDVTVIHCSNDNMDETIKDTIQSAAENKEYDFIIIADISCSKETAEIIDKYAENNKIVLMDHHLTSEWLNKYDWAVITDKMPENSTRRQFYKQTDPEKPLTSATALVYDYIEHHHKIHDFDKHRGLALDLFVQLVSAYDTWEWKNLLNEPVCKELNTLFYLCGAEHFEHKMTARIKLDAINTSEDLFSKEDLVRLKNESDKITRHIESVKNHLLEWTITIDSKDYTAVFAFDNKYPADVIEFMKTEYPDKDIYILSNGHNMSLRSAKPEVNVAQIAKRCGGGGHAFASGLSVPKEIQAKFVEMAMNAKIAF